MTELMTELEYQVWRADAAALARLNNGRGHPYHLCSRCGKCEVAGGFCSWCRTADYVLSAHRHTNGGLRGKAGHSTGIAMDGDYHHPARWTIYDCY